MNVVCLNAGYSTPDAPAAALRTITRGLVQRGHEVTVVALDEPGGALDEAIDGVRVLRLAPSLPAPLALWRWLARDGASRQDAALALLLRRLFSARKPDAVCVHDVGPLTATAWRICAEAGVPVAQVLHDYRVICERRTLLRQPACALPCDNCVTVQGQLRAASSRVDAVVGVSRAVLRAHLAAGLFAGARYEAVIESALDLAPAPVPPRRRPRLEFGYRGPIAPGSGVEALCATFARLHAAHGDAIRLTVSGTGNAGTHPWHGNTIGAPCQAIDRDGHHAPAELPGHETPADDAAHAALLRARHRRDHGIEFTGPMPARDFHAGLDLSIAPAEWEVPWPTAAIESIGHGVPVVAARRGALAEVIAPGVNGLFYEPDVDADLAMVLDRLITDPLRIRAMHRRCRPSIARLLDVERMVDEHEEVIHALTLPRREHARRLHPAD